MSRKAKIFTITILLVLFAGANSILSQTTTFTPKGRMTDGINAAKGSYNFQFALFDALRGGNLGGIFVVGGDDNYITWFDEAE